MLNKALLKMYQSQLNPDSKINTGIKMNNNIWGLMWERIVVLYPITPKDSLQCPIIIPAIISIGV